VEERECEIMQDGGDWYLPKIVKKLARRAALWEKPSSNMIWEKGGGGRDNVTVRAKCDQDISKYWSKCSTNTTSTVSMQDTTPQHACARTYTHMLTTVTNWHDINN
jgi:hypothetical protein